MSGIAIVGALVVSVVLPPVISNASTNQHSNGYVTGLNPFINLGQDLRRGDPVTTIEYSTTSDVPQYFTVTVLKDFDGDAWRPVDREGGIDRIDDIGPVPGRDDKATTATVETTVTIGNVIGRWLPVPYAPRSIEGLDGAWEWNPETLSLWSTDANVAGQTYSVRADLATPSAQELVATGTDRPGGLNAYLRLPEGLDPIVAETAREVVGDVTTNYEKAIALQSYFRSGEFEYSVDAPVDEGYDGPSADVIAKFLKVKSGYCVHFASAFATMARTLDIPARIGVGFTSGERVGAGENGASNYVVTTHDLHAWPELFFDSIGWVRFEPTVGRGLVPAFGDLQADDPETPEFEPTQTPSATPTAGSNTPSATSTPQANDRPDELDPDTGITPRTRANLTWAGILAAVALVLLLPAMWRTGRRARRFRRVRSDGSPFEAWNEIRDTAVDLGSAATESETPRAFAAAITPRLQPNGVDALQRLLATVEAEAYAPDAARRKAGAADLRTVVVALRARAGIAARLRARFVPASVLGRRRVEQPEL
jgi:transglutaminase-like putative cysteine protease